jgi:hypothetical protein
MARHKHMALQHGPTPARAHTHTHTHTFIHTDKERQTPKQRKRDTEREVSHHHWQSKTIRACAHFVAMTPKPPRLATPRQVGSVQVVNILQTSHNLHVSRRSARTQNARTSLQANHRRCVEMFVALDDCAGVPVTPRRDKFHPSILNIHTRSSTA